MLHRCLLPQIGAVTTHLVTKSPQIYYVRLGQFCESSISICLHNYQYLDFLLQHGEQVLPANGKQH